MEDLDEIVATFNKSTEKFNGTIKGKQEYQEPTKKQVELRDEFEELTKPLLKFLCDNYHPHVTILVTPTMAELVEGLMSTCTDEFVKG